MNSNSLFSFPRFSTVFRNDILKLYRPTLIGMVAVLAICLGIYLLTSFSIAMEGDSSESDKYYERLFPILLFIGGFLFTSVSFYEFSRKEQHMQYLLVPASHLEKWLSKWAISSGIFVLVGWLLFGLFADLAMWIASEAWGFETAGFGWFDTETTWFYIRLYLALQTVFLVGAVYFNRYAYFKTPIVMIFASMALFMVAYFSFQIIMAGIAEPWSLDQPDGYQLSEEYGKAMNQWIQDSFKFLLYWIIPPVLWLASYMKLTEKEV